MSSTSEIINAGATKDRRERPEDRISDWYLPEGKAIENGYFWPGRVAVRDHDHLYEMAYVLAERADIMTADGYEEFVIQEGDRRYRGHVLHTIDGRVFALRRMPATVPNIENLGLPDPIRDLLVHPGLSKRGGLIIIGGETGQGKSTTIASVIMRRVEELGSFCLTIEDPPEMPLHGPHGKGIIFQTAARIGGFGDALRGAMRCYPAVGGSMLYVGETRDGETAAEVLRAAVNGHLVLTTIHANNVSTIVQRFMTMAKSVMGSEEEVKSVTAAALRLAMHQELEFVPGIRGQAATRRLKISFGLSTSESSQMAQAIRSPGASLADIVATQAVALKTGGVNKLLGSDWS